MEFHHSSVFANSGSTSKMTPRNGKTLCRTTSPILNFATLSFMVRLPFITKFGDWCRANQDFCASSSHERHILLLHNSLNRNRFKDQIMQHPKFYSVLCASERRTAL